MTTNAPSQRSANCSAYLENLGGEAGWLTESAYQGHKEAVDLDPNDAITLRSFAAFMKDIRRNSKEAQRLNRRAYS
jgi:hypothetical protein